MFKKFLMGVSIVASSSLFGLGIEDLTQAQKESLVEWLKDFNVTENNLSAITDLKIDGLNKNITSLPNEIWYLENLHSFALNNTNLTELPKEIGNLVNLQSLSLNKNSITSFPSEIENLQNLIMLFIYDESLISIPLEIFELKELIILDITRNKNITSLPSEIENLTKLQDFILRDTNITSLPPEIGNLKYLNRLFLDNNKLNKLPSEIGNLSYLQDIYLTENQLTELPPEIGNLPNLYNLFVGRNNLTTLPKELSKLNNLYTLTLDNNNFSYFPKFIGNFKNLNLISLNYNETKELPTTFQNLKNLNTITNYTVANNSIGIGNIDKESNETTKEFFERGGFSWLDPNPTVEIDTTLSDVRVKDTITFTANAEDKDGEVIKYEWDLGNGIYKEGQKIKYSYDNSGNYTIHCVVTDDDGYETTAEYNLSVREWRDDEICEQYNAIWLDGECLCMEGETLEDGKCISSNKATLEVKKGWNLLALPTDIENYPTSNLNYEKLYIYENSNWSENPLTISYSNGFWLKSSENKNYEFSGNRYRPNLIDIDNSWKLLGSGDNMEIDKFNEFNVYLFENGEWKDKNITEKIKQGQAFWIKR